MRRAIIIGLFVIGMLSGCAVAGAGGESAAESGQPVREPGSCAAIPGACAIEHLLTTVVTYMTYVAELAAVFIIAVAVVRAIVAYGRHLTRRSSGQNDYIEDIRLRMGKSLALALEFALASDILKTAVAPSLEIIAQLAAIIVLRTALNYFLEREIRHVEQRRAALHLDDEDDSREAQRPAPLPRQRLKRAAAAETDPADRQA
jgi:uncharacterized membrane protein